MDQKLLLYNIFPVVAIHLLFLPLWFLQQPFFMYNVSLGEMLINILAVPIYLIMLNYRHAVKVEDYTFWPYIFMMWLIALGSNAMTLFNWVLSSGRLVEAGTFYVFQWIIIFNIVCILVFGLIAQAGLSYKKRSRV